MSPVCSGSRTGCRRRDARGDDFHRSPLGGHHRPFAVQGISQGIEHASDDRLADGNGKQLAKRPYFIPFLNLQVIPEDNDADAVFFQVESQPAHPVGELDHLIGHDARQAMDAGNAVAHLQHRADFADIEVALEVLEFRLNDGSDFISAKLHRFDPLIWFLRALQPFPAARSPASRTWQSVAYPGGFSVSLARRFLPRASPTGWRRSHHIRCHRRE